jgi:tetratricopeptide (TPR) repeat protein
MEFVEGQTLRSLLGELGRVPEALCRHVAREVTKGLAAIHAAGAIHRDLKPENVLITGEDAVKIMDLGVARYELETPLSQPGLFVGSIHYAAPEQLAGEGPRLDGRADLHALGVMLYELATGEHPFAHGELGVVIKRVLNERPRRLGERNPQLSTFFEEVVHTLLEKDRERRFGSAAELITVLEKEEGAAWWRDRTRVMRLVAQRPQRRIRIPRETALYGREAEIAKLRSTYFRSKAGDGQVVLIEGEAGIGKTRLIHELVGLLEREGEDLNFLFGSYPPGGAATPAGAFTSAYREQFGHQDLEEALQRYLPRTPGLVPVFSALLRGDAPPKGAELLTKESLQAMFVNATRGLAAERPTVVLIDDLHFAPDEGRALFAALALAAPGHRMLVIGTARPELSPAWVASITRLGHASHLELSRLGAEALGGLLVDVFRSQWLADELAQQIATQSDGNPFFVVEIVRSLREGEFIRQQPDGSWVRTREIGEIQIPSTVTDLIRARIAALADDGSRELLDVAACWGFEFDPVLVAEAMGVDVLSVLRRLGRIEQRERLVRSAGRMYVFDHHQVQEALYAGLFAPLRERYHAALATALEARSGAGKASIEQVDGAICVELAAHFLEGGAGERAIRYLHPALNHLERRYQNAAAVGLADQALAVDGLLRGRERIEVLLFRANRLTMLARPQAIRTTLDEARALADAIADPALQATIGNRLGYLLYQVGKPDEAAQVVGEALDRARVAGDLRTEGALHGTLSNVLRTQGKPHAALAHLERCLELAQVTGSRRGEARANDDLGSLSVQLGLLNEAVGFLERAVAIDRETGDRKGEAFSSIHLANAFGQLGRPEEHRWHLEHGLELARETGDRGVEALALINLAVIAVNRGDRGAREAFIRCRALGAEVGNPVLEGHALLGLAEVEEQMGHADLALGHYREAMEIQVACGDRREIAQSHLHLGRLLFHISAVEDSRSHLTAALSMAQKIDDPDGQAIAYAYLALLPGGDRALMQERFDALSSRLHSMARMEIHYLLWKASGARSHLESAYHLLNEHCGRVSSHERQAMVANVPLHRHIQAAWEELPRA